MPIPLGILAAAGIRPAGGSYELIETITVGAGGAASVTFSNLNTYSTTYQHLQIRGVTRSARTTDSSFTKMVLNSDTASNYSEHYIRGNGSTVSSSGSANASYIHFGDSPAANATSGIFNSVVCDILDAYETSKFKTTRTMSGIYGGGITFVQLWSGNWRSTNAISSVTISDYFGANLAQGTRFSIYGLKAS